MDDIEAIKRLKATYFRSVDTKDWPTLRSVFTDDVVVDTSEAHGDITVGADEFLGFVAPFLADVVTVHHGHMPEIDVTSDSTASGIWAMEDLLVFADGRRIHGFGHYTETYVKAGGAWRIKTLKLTRLHLEDSGPTA